MKSASPQSSSIPHEEKERLAYSLWEQANRPSGLALDFWLKAEEQLAAPLQPRRSASTKIKAPANNKPHAAAPSNNKVKDKRTRAAR